MENGSTSLNMNKLAFCIIVKDDSEKDNLIRCLDSVAPHVDKIFITGTHRPDGEIRKIAKKYNADYSFFEWVKDFSKARNFNFAQAKDYEWIYWQDADDILVGGEHLRDAINLVTPLNIKAVFSRYLYQVELDETGKIKNILIEHLRERLIRNDGTYEWVAPIHETLIEKVPSGKTDYQGFYVVHLVTFPEMEASMWRNIDILEEEVLRNPTDPRPIYYLAKSYFDTKIPEVLYEPAGPGVDSITIELLKDYLRKSGWSEERAQAWEYLSMIHRERAEYKKAIACLMESLIETPVFPSVYIQLALNYVMMGDWSKAMHWVKLSGVIEIPKTTLVINPKDYKCLILEALFHIYLNTGKLEECQKVAHTLAEMVPSELNKGRVVSVDDLKHRNDVAHYVVKLATHLKQTNQLTELKALINSIPKEIVNEPVLVNLRNEMLPPRVWGEKEVAIYCGPHFEQWSWKSSSKGIGGSEEAVIRMSEELVKLGWSVTVYGDPREDEGVHEGVNWLPYYHVNWNDQFNILISWRQIGMFDMNIKAKKTFLWNHDLQNALQYTPERIKRIDKVMFLSRFQREIMGNVPALPKEKEFYTGNGI